jgi:glutaredoxin
VILTIYSRPGCHLCDVMKATVGRVAADCGVAVEEIDISSDPSLEARYGLEIPVLMVDGQKIAKYRVSAEEVRRALAART